MAGSKAVSYRLDSEADTGQEGVRHTQRRAVAQAKKEDVVYAEVAYGKVVLGKTKAFAVATKVRRRQVERYEGQLAQTKEVGVQTYGAQRARDAQSEKEGGEKDVVRQEVGEPENGTQITRVVQKIGRVENVLRRIGETTHKETHKDGIAHTIKDNGARVVNGAALFTRHKL